MSREDFMISGFWESWAVLERLGLLVPEDETLESCMSSSLFPNICLFFLTASISGPVGTNVRDLYFLVPSSPSLWL